MTAVTWQATQPTPAELAPISLGAGLPPPDAGMIAEARRPGGDAEAVFRAAMARAVTEAKSRGWLEDNRKAIEAHAGWVFRRGTRDHLLDVQADLLGDLSIAHRLAVHAMQALPALALPGAGIPLWP
jgi:post-segregation antitoxin (ccd killing protein)